MNAIILTAGKSSRMYNDGIQTPKSLLPIHGIPNIERTIMFLHESNIYNIYIVVRYEHLELFKYLKEEFNCNLIVVKNSYNTLFSMKHVLHLIDDSFIIEGDVVLTKNVFFKPLNSLYYVMQYPLCEDGAWCPIVKDGYIKEFKIGNFKEPCLFGISFWKHSDCSKLVNEIKKHLTPANRYRSDIFWDDCVVNILDKIDICTCEIDSKCACEFNDKKEYEYAQQLCDGYYHNCQKYLLNYKLEIQEPSKYIITFISNISKCAEWQLKLLSHHNQTSNFYNPESKNDKCNTFFENNDYPFMVWDEVRNEYVAYFDVAEANNYLLLRRLFVDESHRHNGIGTKIVLALKLYSNLVQKQLRVNVYDEKAECFYKRLNMKLLFKTYRY